MKCIDAHVHLGDVCAPYTLSSRRSNSRESSNLLENLGYPNLLVRAVSSHWFPKKPLLKYCRHAAAGATVEKLLESMEKNNIAASFVLPIEPAVTSKYVLEMCSKNPRLIPLLSIDFSHLNPDQIHQYIADYLSSYPYKGIKFHPNLQGVHPDSDKAHALYSAAADFNLFVIMHVGKTPFLPNSQRTLALLENVINLPRQFSNTKFVFCHMAKYFDPTNGGYELLREYSNVWLDTSGVAEWMIVNGLKQLKHHRIIFGSDWPYCDPGKSLKIVQRAVHAYAVSTRQDSDEVLNHVLYKNAEALIKGSISTLTI
jgi:predicted TIM-barrel fold metal-dependent hydrolase